MYPYTFNVAICIDYLQREKFPIKQFRNRRFFCGFTGVGDNGPGECSCLLPESVVNQKARVFTPVK